MTKDLEGCRAEVAALKSKVADAENEQKVGNHGVYAYAYMRVCASVCVRVCVCLCTISSGLCQALEANAAYRQKHADLVQRLQGLQGTLATKIGDLDQLHTEFGALVEEK